LRILITGGFGYLAGRLCQYLVTQTNFQIVVATSKKTKSIPGLSEIEIRQIDWHLDDSLNDACLDIDAVVHLAGMNAQNCIDDSVAAIEVNALNTARLVQSAIKQKVKRFIYMSTAHVYGSPLTGIISEQSCPVAIHPYATSHRAGEDSIIAAHHYGNIEGVVIRLSNAFGLPIDKNTNCWTLLVNDLCRQVITSKKMILRTSGLQQRDFISITDVNCAIDHFLKIPKQKLGEGVFNVGGRWSLAVLDMAKIIQERCKVILGFEPELVVPEAIVNEDIAKLDFKTTLLQSSGFQLKNNKLAEIDDLLLYCKKEFA